jgi:hypothetical protein
MMIISTLVQFMEENPEFLRYIKVEHLLFITQVSFASAIAIGLTSHFLGSLCAALVVFLALFSVGIFLLNVLLEKDHYIRKFKNDLTRQRQRLERMYDLENHNYRVNREKRVLALLNKFGEFLTCPILCDVPEDPVVSSTGFIFSEALFNKHWNMHDSNPPCPMTRAPLRFSVVSRPLRQLCNKLYTEKKETEDKIRELQKVMIIM